MHQIPTHLICKSKLTVKLISIIKSMIFCIIHQYNHLCESNISLLLHTPIKGSKKKINAASLENTSFTFMGNI